MKVSDNWLNDLPHQFQCKKNIEILINAFARQMEEVYAVLDDINTQTDLSTAVGKNLDYIGNIVNLTRKDACVLLRKATTTVITDEVYRKVLLFKIVINTTDCTYEDIMEALSLFWETEDIQYIENIDDRPATIGILLPTYGIDREDPVVGRNLCIKPGGVQINYIVQFHEEICITGLESANMPSVIFTFGIPYFRGWYLDGTWMLDGNVPLIGIKEPYKFGIGYTFRVPIDFDQWFLDGEWMLDGNRKLNVGVREHFNGFVEMRRNAWQLDGAYSLNGVRMLNAEIWKEAI